MKVNKSQKRLFIILGVVVAYAAYDFISNRSDYEVYSGGGKTVVVKPSKNVILKANVQKAQVKDLDFKWKKDPFYRDDIPKKILKKKRRIKPKERPLRLQAITFSDQNSFVMINDLILSEGEYVQGYMVKKIERTRVKLIKNGKEIYLSSK